MKSGQINTLCYGKSIKEATRIFINNTGQINSGYCINVQYQKQEDVWPLLLNILLSALE